MTLVTHCVRQKKIFFGGNEAEEAVDLVTVIQALSPKSARKGERKKKKGEQ
jgi:hypothetical protein